MTDKCPICGRMTFNYESYSDECYGTVEQHGYCSSCGYLIEQCYSPTLDCFVDCAKGGKGYYGYGEKNIRKHKRVRRKLGNSIKMIPVNPIWARYI